MEIIRLKAWEMREKLRNKELSAVEILNSHLSQIDKEEQNLNAFITLDRENALKSAKAIDKKIAENSKLGLLAGIPIGLKDNIMTKGIRTTCASKVV